MLFHYLKNMLVSFNETTINVSPLIPYHPDFFSVSPMRPGNALGTKK